MSQIADVLPEADISFTFAYTFIFASCTVGVLFGLYNWYSVMKIKPELKEHDIDTESPLINNSNITLMHDISTKIQNVSLNFLFFIGSNDFLIF
jgi:hypothetical protein